MINRKNVSCRVPLFFQPKGQPYCGAVASKMVLAYHGRNYSLRRIVREMGVRRTRGIDLPSMGSWFLENEFDATLVACLKCLPPRFVSLSPEKVNDEVLRWCRRKVEEPDHLRRLYRRVLPQFLERGGVFVPRPVAMCDLKNALRRKEPPILNLTVGGLYGIRTWSAGHYVVPAAFKGREVMINDSSSRGGRKRYTADELLHACYAWTSGALFVKPR